MTSRAEVAMKSTMKPPQRAATTTSSWVDLPDPQSDPEPMGSASITVLLVDGAGEGSVGELGDDLVAGAGVGNASHDGAVCGSGDGPASP